MRKISLIETQVNQQVTEIKHALDGLNKKNDVFQVKSLTTQMDIKTKGIANLKLLGSQVSELKKDIKALTMLVPVGIESKGERKISSKAYSATMKTLKKSMDVFKKQAEAVAKTITADIENI
jgi:hypothetical protein